MGNPLNYKSRFNKKGPLLVISMTISAVIMIIVLIVGLAHPPKGSICGPNYLVVKEYDSTNGDILAVYCKKIEDTEYGIRQSNIKG